MPEGFGSIVEGHNNCPTVFESSTRENYDKSYWIPERIYTNVANFFEKLERNEQRMRAERQSQKQGRVLLMLLIYLYGVTIVT